MPSSLEVVVRVQSSYFELTSSKYRLAISENTLIPSLKHQNDKRFKIVLELSAMDPCYTRRMKAFEAAGVPVELEERAVLHRRIEISPDDDDVLHPDFVGATRIPEEPGLNKRLVFPNGYIFHHGKLSVWNGHPEQVPVIQFVEESCDSIKESSVVSRSLSWIAVRHQMNRSLLLNQNLSENEITRLNWSCWKQNIVQRYCKTEMKQATANGSTVDVFRSKSIVFAMGSARRRRKH